MRLKADNSGKIVIAVWLFLLTFSFSLNYADAAQMSDYCITPPYIGSSLEPNLLLMIDNSASMYDPTYTKPQSFCFDDTYDDTSAYDGLFYQTSMYCYSSRNDSHNTSCIYSPWYNEFDGWATMPWTCTYGGASSATPFVCVNTQVDAVTGKEMVTEFIASGKFLNWLAMSKFDIEKKILTGGKYDSNSADLAAETRGCDGRKFIKSVPGIGLTFAIRGGKTSLSTSATGTTGKGSGVASQATAYGQTYIEVYKGIYDSIDCLKAVDDWLTVDSTQQGQLQTHTTACVGAAPGNVSNAISTYNEIVHDCYWYYTGHGLTNLNALEQQCQQDWGFYPNGAADITFNAGDAVCGGTTANPFTHLLNNNNTIGYLGLCYNITSGKWDDKCALQENQDFCAGLGVSPTTDPPSTTLPGTLQNVPGFVMEAGLYNMPILNDYSPYNGETGFRVEVYDPWHVTPWPPTGLIDKYKNMIRFGVMTFQNDGSASECNRNGQCSISTSTACVADSNCPKYSSGERCMYPVPCGKVCSTTNTQHCYQNSDCPDGESCVSLTKTDGGIIPPNGYIGQGTCAASPATQCTVDADCGGNDTCNAQVGDHTSGLIQQIDSIVASSWTPFAEAFYNAMGYYARSNDYTQGVTPTSRDLNFSGLPSSYGTNKNPSQKPCQKNNVLIITDGMSTADQNSSSEALASAYASLATVKVGAQTYSNYSGFDTTNSCPTYAGSRSLPVLTWMANNRDIKDLSLTDPTMKHCTNDLFGPTCTSDADCGSGNLCTNLPTRSSESIQTWIVYTGQTTSIFPGLCDPLTFMTAAATNGGTRLFQAADVTQLNTELDNAFNQVAAKASSGTAASVLASGEGSGANIIQAVFYPHRKFYYCSNGVNTPCTVDSDCGAGNTCVYDEISWIGRLTNLWYFVDPNAQTSTIREDDGSSSSSNSTPWLGNKILDTKAPDASGTNSKSPNGDFIVQMYYDKISGVTKANRWTDTNGDSKIDASLPTINFEDMGYLWEAGTLLWKMDPSKRSIKTSIGGGLIDFSTGNAGTLAPYLSTSITTTLIRWTRGEDFPGVLRSRSVMMPSIDSTYRVWKLGDIVNSTAKVMSWIPLNYYFTRYQDTTYGSASGHLEDPVDNTTFTTTQNYKNRGIIFTGGNDGMLHAFKLGTPQQRWTNPTQLSTEMARLMVDSTSGTYCQTGLPGDGTSPTCGQEVWAFIPKNALPYLKYIADPAYCHLYSIDLTPVVFDASIGDPSSGDVSSITKTPSYWRTIVIGGMRFGGACKSSTNACTNCVKTPISVNGVDVGYSSYFAIDVTDPQPANWKLLWEFSDPALGFSTTGPAVVRIGDKSKNGNWFVVFGSGPTGPISTGDHQFLGQSDQNLQLFILNLKTGVVKRTIDTTISNAFAGSMIGSALDLDDTDYQDELVYVPYVRKDTTTWTNGGVGRLMTMRDPDPNKWNFNRLIDGVGPVSTGVAKAHDMFHKNLWVYFGTGRYYYAQNNASDDPEGRRYLFGIKDPCETPMLNNIACTEHDPAYQWSSTNDGCSTPTNSAPCTTPALVSSGSSTTGTIWNLTNVTDTANVPSQSTADDPSFHGWYISLDGDGLFTYPPDSATLFWAERSINNPLVTTSQNVFFTSFKPYTDLCLLGGKSFVWAVTFDTGGAPTGLSGLALVQASTGAIQQINLGSAFTDAGNRKTSASLSIEGLAGGGLSVQTAPPAVQRIMHIRER